MIDISSITFPILFLDIVGAFVDAIGEVFKELIYDPIRGFITDGLGSAIDFMLFIPSPNPAGGLIFGVPQSDLWRDIYSAYWENWVPLGLLILFTSFMMRKFGVAWGLMATKRFSGMKRNVIQGIFLIPMSWYVLVIALRGFTGLNNVLKPSGVEYKNVFGELLQASGAAVFVYIIAGGFNLLLVFLAIIMSLLRILVILIFVVAIPVLLGFKYGRLPYLEKIADSLIGKFPMVLIMTLPIAFGLRVSVLLLGSDGFSFESSTLDTTASIVEPMLFAIPAILGILSPIVLWRTNISTSTARGLSRLGRNATGAGSVESQLKGPGQKLKKTKQKVRID